MSRIFHNMLYKIEFLNPFTDGNMPEGFVSFKKGQVVEDVPGSVLTRMLQSAPDDIQVVGEMIPPSNISAAARKLAEENDIDISTVKGTGRGGSIIKADIEALIEK